MDSQPAADCAHQDWRLLLVGARRFGPRQGPGSRVRASSRSARCWPATSTPHALVGGVPAKVVRPLKDDDLVLRSPKDSRRHPRRSLRIVRAEFIAELLCPGCGGGLALRGPETAATCRKASLGARAAAVPVIAGVPRVLPADLAPTLLAEQPAFFERHPYAAPSTGQGVAPRRSRPWTAFGDEWRRLPELHAVHKENIRMVFRGPAPRIWAGSEL